MKTKLLVISLASFIALASNAQWVQQTSMSSANLTGIHCTHLDTCFAAGSTGNIRKTVNGGTNWAVISSGTITNISSVKMHTNQDIWCGLVNGTFRHSSNGGTSWATVSTGASATHYIYDMWFHDPNNFFAVGGSNSNQASGGHVGITSTNGGTSWTAVNSSGVPTFFGNHFFNSSVGVVSAGAETIYKTYDGGATWVKKDSGAAGSYYDIHFPTSSVGYAAGGSSSSPSTGGIMKKTIDSGNTWLPVTLPIANTLYGVHFVNADTGFAVGNGGKIICTTDGGLNWIVQASPVSTDLNKIIMMNDSVGYICGASGVILKTLNGGGYLTTGINENNSQNLFSVYGNPSHTEIKIETKFEMHNAELNIYSSLGQKMEALKNISGNTISIKSASYQNGIYFFELRNEGKIIEGKFVVE